MATIDTIIQALQDTTIAKRVSIPHENARANYSHLGRTVRDWPSFEEAIGDYYAFHFTQCVSQGGRLPRAEAVGRAKRLLEQQYRRRRGDLMTAFADARDGTNSGLRGVIDALTDGIKAESTEFYIRDVWDSRIAPCDYEAKVRIIREFFRTCGHYLHNSIQLDRPERYAHNYEPIIMAYIDGLQQVNSGLRRL